MEKLKSVTTRKMSPRLQAIIDEKDAEIQKLTVKLEASKSEIGSLMEAKAEEILKTRIKEAEVKSELQKTEDTDEITKK